MAGNQENATPTLLDPAWHERTQAELLKLVTDCGGKPDTSRDREIVDLLVAWLGCVDKAGTAPTEVQL